MYIPVWLIVGVLAAVGIYFFRWQKITRWFKLQYCCYQVEAAAKRGDTGAAVRGVQSRRNRMELGSAKMERRNNVIGRIFLHRAPQPNREFKLGDRVRVNLHRGKIEDAIVKAASKERKEALT